MLIIAKMQTSAKLPFFVFRFVSKIDKCYVRRVLLSISELEEKNVIHELKTEWKHVSSDKRGKRHAGHLKTLALVS